MKYKLLLLAFIGMTLTGMAQNRIDNQGRRQGRWIKTDKDGSRIFEGEFKDGKEVGVFNYYYPDGTLRIRNTFTVPGRYCRHEAYDQKGHLLATGFFDQKNRDSVWNFFNEDGKLIKIATYKTGVKQGTHVILSANGDTAEVMTWLDNRRHGRWWKRIGAKGYITGRYEMGLMQGRLVEYDDNGQMVRDGNYKDGAKEGRYRYFEDNVCTIDEKWSSSVLVDRKILVHAQAERWLSINEIAYFLPKGRSGNGTTVYLSDGTSLACTDDADIINERVGHEHFVLIDRRSRLMANTSSIVDIVKDSDGRDILDLSPKPPFTVFPDEECVKIIRSLKRTDQLDE